MYSALASDAGGAVLLLLEKCTDDQSSSIVTFADRPQKLKTDEAALARARVKDRFTRG